MVKLGQVIFTVVLVYLIDLPLLLADYTIKDGETGKYRWYNKGSQSYHVCCYCPIEAVSSDDYNMAFQVDECVENEPEENNTLFPFCACEAKNGLIPEFIGCKLPKNDAVDWRCDNGFVYPNVSVYTTCKPDCKDDGMVLVNHGSLSYRCNEQKQWEENPFDVSCYVEVVEQNPNNTTQMIVLGVGLGFCLLLIVVVVGATRRKWYPRITAARRKFCNSSSDHHSIQYTTTTDMTVFSTETYSTSVDSNTQCTTDLSVVTENPVYDENKLESRQTCDKDSQQHGNQNSCSSNDNDESLDTNIYNRDEENSSYSTSISEKEKKEERMPLISGETKPIVKVNGLEEIYKNGGIYYNVIIGNRVVIVTCITVQIHSDFTIDRQYDRQSHNYYVIDKVQTRNEGIYNWKVIQRYKDGNKEVKTGCFHLNVIDKERPEPVGGSTWSLPNQPPNTVSIATVEEDVLEVDGQGCTSIQNEAICCSRGLTRYLSTSQSSFESQDFKDNFPQQQENAIILKNSDIGELDKKGCTKCSLSLSKALGIHDSSQHLNNICIMLDPSRKNAGQCWMGFVKFYKTELKIEEYHIDNIRYHTKGNPADGHMQYILNNYLCAHGFTVGDLVHYFSQENSRREDVLKEIKKFHQNCQFCDKYLKPLQNHHIS